MQQSGGLLRATARRSATEIKSSPATGTKKQHPIGVLFFNIESGHRPLFTKSFPFVFKAVTLCS
jgi:hypothetical protein